MINKLLDELRAHAFKGEDPKAVRVYVGKKGKLLSKPEGEDSRDARIEYRLVMPRYPSIVGRVQAGDFRNALDLIEKEKQYVSKLGLLKYINAMPIMQTLNKLLDVLKHA